MCALPPVGRDQIAGLLAALVDKSLMQASRSAANAPITSSSRYRRLAEVAGILAASDRLFGPYYRRLRVGRSLPYS